MEENSVIVYAKTTRRRQYGNDRHILVSQVITKETHEDFSEDELFPLKEILYTDPEKNGAYGPVTVCLKNGTEKTADFNKIEGSLQM